MNKFFLLVLLVVSVYSCSNAQVEGGPCSYETRTLPAKVVEIKKIGSNWTDVIFTIKRDENSNELDTISYYNETKEWISIDSLEEMEIKIGDEYKYKIMDITKGSCNPHIENLVMEKY